MPASTPLRYAWRIRPTSLTESTTMPTVGNISPKARRCLENMAVAGPVTALELNALDPSAPDHRQTIKALEASKYVVVHDHPKQAKLANYSLTDKAKRLLAGHALQTADKKPRPKPTLPKYANQPRPNVAAPVTHGSMTTKRLTHACADMLAPAVRPGAEQALSIPSRVNNTLHYRDGRVEPIKHRSA